ncbi:hypothetical protein [Bosea sp. PAMC 26642]|nr:hypothetical protein [Bosea sp. PAMC 26642]
MGKVADLRQSAALWVKPHQLERLEKGLARIAEGKSLRSKLVVTTIVQPG